MMSKDFHPPFSVRQFYAGFMVLNSKGEPEAIFRTINDARELAKSLNEYARTQEENRE